jgi:hypothetical protein
VAIVAGRSDHGTDHARSRPITPQGDHVFPSLYKRGNVRPARQHGLSAGRVWAFIRQLPLPLHCPYLVRKRCAMHSPESEMR